MSQANPNKMLSVNILNKEYQIACPPKQQAELFEAAEYLNDRMIDIKNQGIFGLDRIAVIAALNISHEMLQKAQSIDNSNSLHDDRIKGLSDKIDDFFESVSESNG